MVQGDRNRIRKGRGSRGGGGRARREGQRKEEGEQARKRLKGTGE